MDFFDNLPEIAFLRIFDYLPLKDRFRVGRVSQTFRRISLDVNGRMKSLNLDDPMFRRAGMADQFGGVLRLCHHKLREIKFRQGFGLLPSIFSEFTCPQLIDLNLGHNLIKAADFARIITNHPNLKSLKLSSYDDVGCFMTYVEFPPVTLSNLETLHVHNMNDAALERLIDRCPHLKHLEMTLSDASSEDILDRFFRSVPRLESLRLQSFLCDIKMENLEWFWGLPLTSLTIAFFDPAEVEFMVNDDVVYKLIEHFTNIEYLDLWLTNASDGAVASLARLEKLRVAKFCVPNDVHADGLIHEFTGCRHLEELFVHFNFLTDQTFLELFRSCPRLNKLKICGVFNNNGCIDADTAGMLNLELMNVPHRPSITIEIRCASYENGLELQTVWESIQVQNAVQHVRESRGMQIDIRLVDMPPPPPVDVMMVQGGDLEAENGDQMDGDHVDAGQADGGQMGGHQPDA